MNFYDDISRFGERIAISTETGEELTYSSIISKANELTRTMSSRCLVFLICENSYEPITAFIGFLRKRVVVALINHKIDRELFVSLLSTYKPQYIFCKNGWHEEGQAVAHLGDFHLLKTEHQALPTINPELAVMIATSGSTGSPKFVMQSYKNITSNAAAIADYLQIKPDDRAITTLPMSYTYGLSIIQSHFIQGAQVIATERTLMDKAFWQLLKEREATTFGGVPYIYEMLKKLHFDRMDVPSLRYITQAGGKLSKELVVEFSGICREKGIELIVMYGQTEATARMSYLPWQNITDKTASIGVAIPGGKFSLIDANGDTISMPDTAGELVYHGDNVALGYAEKLEDLSKADEWHGELHTGDVATRDADGFYYIVGRLKRFLKLFGNRVNLDEAEQLLKQAGFQCVCGGKDDLLKIYIVQADEAELERAIDYISQKTGLNRSAFSAFSIAEIPRSDSGKILYADLERLYG